MASLRPNATARRSPAPSADTSPVLTLTLNPAIDLDLVIPSWRPGKVARTVAVARQAGGKGVNVARALTTLGVVATAAVTLGEPDAAVYRALLADAPFEVVALAAPGPTRTNVTLRAQAGADASRRVKVNQPGPRWLRADAERLLAAIEPLLAGRRWVVLAGALPPGLPVNFYARLVTMARRSGARVAIDAAGPALRRALAARPDLVRVNRQELYETLACAPDATPPRRETMFAAATRLVTMGAGMAAISDGARTALLVTAGLEAWTARPPKIEPCGPLGAGDAMLAGLIAAFLEEKTAGEALRLGLACGAAAAAETETRPPRHRAIQALATRVAVKPRRTSI